MPRRRLPTDVWNGTPDTQDLASMDTEPVDMCGMRGIVAGPGTWTVGATPEPDFSLRSALGEDFLSTLQIIRARGSLELSRS